MKFCCLRNKSALYDLGAGLYAVQSVENHACRCGPEGRDRPPDLESTGLRGAGGVRVGPAGQELLQSEELRGPELHDGPLATSGRACRFANSGRACKSCRDCVRVPPTWAACQVRTCLQIVQRLLCRRAALQAAPVLSVPAGPTPGQPLLSSSSSSNADPTRAIGCWTDSPARTARRPSTRAVSHSCSRLLGSCWTAVTPAAAALQAAPAHSVPAGPTAPPGQLAAQLVLVESRQSSSRPRPCSQTLLQQQHPSRTWFLLYRQPRQDSSPPKHPGSHSLLQQHSRTCASSSWTDSPRLGRTPNGGAVGDLQKPAGDREAREEEAGSFGLMPHHK